jgi:hypothetical protein
MFHVILGLLGSLTLGHPEYPVRHTSERVLRSHPYLAASASVVTCYHPDAEVRRIGRRLWSPRLSDCFYLTLKPKEPRDIIHTEVVEAAERLGIKFEYDDIGWYWPQPPTYSDRLYTKSRVLMFLPLTITPR